MKVAAQFTDLWAQARPQTGGDTWPRQSMGERVIDFAAKHRIPRTYRDFRSLLADKEIDRTKAVAREVMEGAATLSVPLVVDTGVGQNWAAAH